jgi:effector-binding domain-containing protein
MHEVHLHTTTAQPTAVIRARVAQRDLARAVPAYCGEVWAFARAANLDHPGRHVAVYLDGAITLECGVEVAAPFIGTDRVVCSRTPAGLAATTTHIGGYDQLGEAHAAIHEWCAQHGVRLAGPSWEVYDHWVDPPAQPRTEIYYLVAAASG